MPQKRQAGSTRACSNDPGDDGKPKKRRVSLACDACRAAREKCDGARPRCGTCAALARHCSYTPATKKRGVQTGYLRTIELSLAWLFDQIPESEQALLRLLAQPTPGREARALLGKGSAGRHLQKIWSETRVRKAIDALLADTRLVPSDSSGNEQISAAYHRPPGFFHLHVDDGGDSYTPKLAASLTAKATQYCSTDTPGSDRGHGIVLKLPPHWERLVAVYVSYTHCWLPILRPEALRSLAKSYGASGIHIDLEGDRSLCSRHSELWAALAIAAFQDGSCSEYELSLECSASYIFRVARSLVPGNDEAINLHNTSAIILHSVILVGRGEIVSASLLLGKAARLLKRLQFGQGSGSDDGDSCTSRDQSRVIERIQLDTARMACSLLATLTSLSMDQQIVADVCDAARNISQSTAEFTGFDQIWHSVPCADVPRQFSQTVASSKMEPIHTLTQLHVLTTVLRAIVYGKLHVDRQTRPMDVDDVARTLDPRFQYCHSFMPSSSTSIIPIPSAFLVKLLFLTVTNEVSPHLRMSLFSGFLETMETMFANFGAARSPPVVSLLLHIWQKRATGSDISEAEQSRWRLAVHRLHSIWQDGGLDYDVDVEGLLQEQDDVVPRKAMGPIHQVVAAASQALQIEAHPMSKPGSGSSRSGPFRHNSSAGNKHAVEPPTLGYSHSASSNPYYPAHVVMPYAASSGGKENTQLVFPGGHRITPNVDYDALFEDLGSVGYTETMEMDTRFMTDLGFAPGCDLAEMFQGGRGV
ncbi:hypothetical protein E4U21_002704 [Claviceps maximensis]|nr:hypothetical protein E4U21_002704 [Claviceps maximensis]